MPRLCVVMPCHNEARRLDVDAVRAHLRAHPDTALCGVDDGSRDGTGDVLARLAAECPEQVIVVSLPARRGKAEAVRQGVLHALSQTDAGVIGYWDADLAAPLTELDAMAAALETSPQTIAAIGARWKRLGSQITRSAVRHYLGRVFATAASVTLGLPVYDTQCGAKLFRRDAAARAFEAPFSTRWLFDVEVLARLRNHYGARAVTAHVIEVPLQVWSHVGGSKLKPRHYLIAPLDLWRIARRYNGR